MANFKIEIESVPKNAAIGFIPNKELWNINNFGDAKDMVQHQRELHNKKSKWYKIYKNDKLIFDSNLIRR